MTALPLPIGWWTSGIQFSGRQRSPRRRASSRRRARSQSRSAFGRPAGVRRSDRDTILEGRRPRTSGHSEASCTPYGVGNHTRVPSGLRQGDAVDQHSARSPANRRRVRSMHTSGAITLCICSVVAIRYCSARTEPAGLRCLPPRRSSRICSLPVRCGAGLPGAARPGHGSSRPDQTTDHEGPTTVTKRQRLRGQAHIPADNRGGATPVRILCHVCPRIRGSPGWPCRRREADIPSTLPDHER
jgi:hypothetical protein